MSSSNPIRLPPRFEIRQLLAEHHDWAAAIISHANIYHSPAWSPIHADDKPQRTYGLFKGVDLFVAHSITSGFAYGVFDTEYEFKKPASAATGGALYWDGDDLDDVTSADLVAQMDFPLVSIALAFDAFEAMGAAEIGPVLAWLPMMGVGVGILDGRFKAATEAAKVTPQGPRQVLMRNGTATRRDYEGLGLARRLGQWMMFEARDVWGFRAIQIDTASPAVDKTWMHPPEGSGMVSTKVCALDMGTHEEEGNKVFAPADVVMSRVWVDLKPAAAEA